MINFNLRKAYLFFISLYIIIMYFIRGILLYNNPELFSLKKHFFIINKNFEFSNLPLKLIVIFVFYLYFISFFIPKKVKCFSLKNYKIYEILFYLQICFLIILSFNIKMGFKVNSLNYLFLGILESILGKEFLFFIVLYNRIILKKKYMFLFFIYSIPVILIGSKIGLIYPVLTLFFFNIGLNKKKFTFKSVFVSLMLYILYPTFYSLSWALRGKKIENFKIEFDFIRPFYLLTHRITGLDILNMQYEKISNINRLDMKYFMFNLLRGLIPSGVLSRIFKYRNIGYGRYFAEIVYNQPQKLVSGYESTLFGVFYYNNNRVIIFVIFNLIFFLVLYKIKNLNYKFRGVISLFFVYNFIDLIRTGNYNKLLLPLRFYIAIFIIEIILTTIKRRNYITNEKV